MSAPRLTLIKPPSDSVTPSHRDHRRCRRCGTMRTPELLYVAWGRVDVDGTAFMTYECRDGSLCDKALKLLVRRKSDADCP